MEGGNAHSAVEAGQHRSGPIVWASIIAATCLLLFFFQKILWLVVPFLLGLILYYFLYPAMQALIYRGMSREAAAGNVTLGFLVLLSVIGVAVTPWVAGHAAGWQESLVRYLQGGNCSTARCGALKATGRPWPTRNWRTRWRSGSTKARAS